MVLLAMILIVLVATALVLFYRFIHPKIGAPPSTRDMQATLKKHREGTPYHGGRFRNFTPTSTVALKDYLPMLRDYYRLRHNETRPRKPLTTLPFNRDSEVPNNTVTWLGHSSLFVKLSHQGILFDPTFGPSASPLPFLVKNFEYTHPYRIENFPTVDVLVITHDHYDHLSYESVRPLRGLVKRVITPLGVGSRLCSWGFDPAVICELSWYESVEVEGIRFTAIPSQHFSGRSLFDMNKTLWAGWMIKNHQFNLFHGGDSGYFPLFKRLGEEYGPFDVAFVENGAYNRFWSKIHLFPEESVQVALDIRAKQYLPIHWGKFSLAMHPWDEPIERAKKALDKTSVTLLSPRIGETIPLEGAKTTAWWNVAWA